MDPYEINLIVEVHVLGYGKFHLIDGDNSMSNRRVEFEPKGKISVSNMLKSKPKKKKNMKEEIQISQPAIMESLLTAPKSGRDRLDEVLEVED